MIASISQISLKIAILAITAILSSAIYFPLTNDVISVSAGQIIFGERCASCHSLGKKQSGLGPSLSQIGNASAHRVQGLSSTEYILQSLLYPNAFMAGTTQMPGGLTSDLSHYELLSLIAFLQSLGSKPDYDELLAIEQKQEAKDSIPPTVLALSDVESGRKLFFGKFQCGTCHTFEPTPGSFLLGPSLKGVGYLSEREIKNSIKNPHDRIAPQYVIHQVVTQDGDSISGLVIRDTDTELVILSRKSSGGFTINRLRKDEIELRRESPNSLMPAWGNDAMQEIELQQVIAFLKTQT